MWNVHLWFNLSDSVSVYMAFAQDELDVVYLDHMAYLIDLCAYTEDQLDYEDLPLFYLLDELLGRR